MFRRKPRQDADWVRSVLETYEAPLTRFASRLLRDPEKSRDVVQETFMKLWEAERSRVEDHLAEWLYTVCRNRALEIRRKEKRMKPLFDADSVESPGDSPSGAIESREETSEMMRALGALTPQQQEVVRLRFQNGLSYKEIANVTGLTVSNVGYLVHMAVKAMREAVATTEPRAIRAGGAK